MHDGWREIEVSGSGSTGKSQVSEGVVHGGRLAEARRLFPDAPEPFLDLSTGINPFAYALPAMRAEWFTRLPEPESVAALQAAAAAAYGVADPAMAVAAPGTQILIDLLPRLWPVRSVAVLAPTYAEHARAWSRITRAVRQVGEPALLKTAEAVVICNPNNPDGRRVPRDEVLELADRLAAHGGFVLVDESFADLEPGRLSVADALPHPGLIILRSFGKTYGLAGLRLGFALAEPGRAAVIRDALGPWAVSGPAIAIGREALADDRWRSEAATRLASAARGLDAELARAGVPVIGGTCLFRLAETERAAALYEALGRAGLFVRRFPGSPRWLRFGLPPCALAWQRLTHVLSSWAAARDE